MARSPDSQIPLGGEQFPVKKRNDKASVRRRGGQANARAATRVNAVSASSTPPTSKPAQLELFPGRACLPKAKPATDQESARGTNLARRDGVEGGGTRGQNREITGEARLSLAEAPASAGREAYKGEPEIAGTRLSRESEVVIVPKNFGITEGREGPLLPSRGRRRERPPDCPRERRLHPGRRRTQASRRFAWTQPANFNGHYTGLPSSNQTGDSRHSTLVGKVSHLEGLRRMHSEEDGRRAGCGKSACPVR